MTYWDEKRAALQQKLKGDLSDFLRWAEIGITMHVGDDKFTRHELAYLQSLPDWATRWQLATLETPVGSPYMFPEIPTSPNLIHMAYHLARWEAVTGLRVRQLGSIYEIGAGYGAMCRLIHRLGFSGNYFIYDLPELVQIQAYFLEESGTRGAIRWTNELPKSADLLLSTWALSEIPEGERDRLITTKANSYLLAYQPSFEDTDNRAWFSAFAASRSSEYGWVSEDLAHMDGGHRYLFGVRKQVA